MTTSWTVWGSNPCGAEIFLTRPVRSWDPQCFLYNGYRFSFPGLKRPGRDLDQPPSSADVKERVELYFSPFGPSWPLPLLFYIHQSLCLCNWTRLPVELLTWNFILRIFTAIYVPDSVLIKIEQKLNRHIAWGPTYVPSDFSPFTSTANTVENPDTIWRVTDSLSALGNYGRSYKLYSWLHVHNMAPHRYMRFLVVWRDYLVTKSLRHFPLQLSAPSSCDLYAA
jgi:hypothetical protein